MSYEIILINYVNIIIHYCQVHCIFINLDLTLMKRYEKISFFQTPYAGAVRLLPDSI